MQSAPRIVRSSLFLPLILSGLLRAAEEPNRLFARPEVPAFWKGRVEDVEAAVREVKRGSVEMVARSPGGRGVWLVAYGSREDLASQANYSSAVAAGDPSYYARKLSTTKPIVFLVGPTHGQEVEGVVGLVNLLRVAETGTDLRGKGWPRLRSGIDRCRLVVVPLSNPDGRARCPYDSFVGLPTVEMTRVGQGTRKDGTPYGWPGAKQRHPMQGDVGFLGAYFNDDGINPMHDEFFEPRALETRALLRIARNEAPDYAVLLHSHAASPAILPTHYVARHVKDTAAAFAARLRDRYLRDGLPAGNPPEPEEDGLTYPGPALNLTGAIHHSCGAVSMTFECPHGVVDSKYARLSHDQILEVQLSLYEELLAFALETPRPGK